MSATPDLALGAREARLAAMPAAFRNPVSRSDGRHGPCRKEITMKLVDSVKEVLGLDTSLAAFRTKLGHKTAEHAALGQELETMLTQHPIRDDGAAVPALVDAHRAALIERHPALRDLAVALTGVLVWDTNGDVHHGPAHVPDVLGDLSAFDLAVLLDPAGTAARLQALLPIGDAGGRTIPQRLHRIAAIKREQERSAGEHAALVDRAEELGIHVEHLPETIAARRAAQHEGDRLDRQREEDAYNERRRGRS
jgi:hypothetical protein